MPDVTQHPIFEPDGAITVYKNVPLDKSYEHSVNYSTQAAFVTALSAYNHTTLSNQSYSRLTQNSVRVELNFSYLKDCNYMMITDANLYGGKVYFCFIDTVEYINNVTCDIFFTIDVLQTYYHDFTMRENFVEREHCLLSDDVIGKNLVPENIGTGEKIIHNTFWRTIGTSNNMYTVVMYLPNSHADEPYIIYVNGECRGVSDLTTEQYNYQKYPSKRNKLGAPIFCLPIPSGYPAAVEDAVRILTENSGTIVAIFQIPWEMYIDNWNTENVNQHYQPFLQINSFKYNNSNSVYRPKNKKLYTSPFRELIVSNENGGNAELKWELFSTREEESVKAEFNVINAFVPSPKSYIYPLNYRNISHDYVSGLSLEDFPQCSWTEDSFTKWWAQNKANFGISLLTQSLMTLLTFKTGGMTGNLSNIAGGSADVALSKNGAFSLGMGAMGIGRTFAQLETAKAVPNSAHIQNNAAIINVLLERFGFVLYDIGVTGEMAEIIDKYFEMYGYATHKVKIPNFISNGRPVWDYVKLQACQIEARTNGVGLNGEYIDQIQSIFNNGITLWKSLANVGNYSLDNHTA